MAHEYEGIREVEPYMLDICKQGGFHAVIAGEIHTKINNELFLDRFKSILKQEPDEVELLRARVERLEEALPDPDKLEILARWFDMQYPADTNPEVQTDLREWAKKIRNVLEEK